MAERNEWLSLKDIFTSKERNFIHPSYVIAFIYLKDEDYCPFARRINARELLLRIYNFQRCPATIKMRGESCEGGMQNGDIKQMHNIITTWTANNTPRQNKQQIAIAIK